jgi:hypothetical protein
MLALKEIDYKTVSSKEKMLPVGIFEKAKKVTVLVECLR